ncbi:MAG: bacterial transcriptional activator domain-containing protein [Chloroflexota bacterium]
MLVNEARSLSPYQPIKQDLLLKAQILYRGEFLPTCMATWADSLRQRFHNLWIDCLTGLSGCADKTGDVDRALNYLNTLLASEPYREDTYRRVMLLLANHGRRDHLQKYWEQLNTVLAADLSISPSPQTTDLYRRVISA